jgi:hypothetical protein
MGFKEEQYKCQLKKNALNKTYPFVFATYSEILKIKYSTFFIKGLGKKGKKNRKKWKNTSTVEKCRVWGIGHSEITNGSRRKGQGH